MVKSLFEQLGGTYHEENGYLIPDLRLPTREEQPIGTWEQRYMDYLEQNRFKIKWIKFPSTRNTNMLPFSVGVWQYGFESQSRYIALWIQARENTPIIRGAV